ncbi:hypothetical protein L1S32_10365 [Methanogenium sp. S4BF]|uniref:hypothetical protein n=1 Tax=Methanogenium sp. S4BF TaxID=1789226 RepID=UPI0024174ACA|nr:hypothetical protein [Methanogenium sp. S4BF]WFN34235.1 hypothetical protein L1S32_10365 [Methanogenium sp. S4BF]
MNDNSLCAGQPSYQNGCPGYLSDEIRKMVAGCIDEYCGEGASLMIFQSPETFGTAPLWEDAGISPPQEIALLIELLHRASLRAGDG